MIIPLLAAYMQVRDLVGIEAEDQMEFDYIGDGTLRLRKPGI